MWQTERSGTVMVVRLVPGPTANVLAPEQTWSQLDVVVGEHPKGAWLIDVSSERVLTSEALAVMIGMVRRIQGAGGRVGFASCSPGVVNVLKSMRLSKLLHLYQTVQEGVADLSVGSRPGIPAAPSA